MSTMLAVPPDISIVSDRIDAPIRAAGYSSMLHVDDPFRIRFASSHDAKQLRVGASSLIGTGAAQLVDQSPSTPNLLPQTQPGRFAGARVRTCARHEVGFVKASESTLECVGERWPQGVITPIRAHIPALTSALVPDRVSQARLDVLVVALLDVLAHLNTRQPAGVHRPQRIDDEAGVRLDHVDHRVVAEPRIRPHDHEVVREVGDRRPEVGADPAVVPSLLERPPVAAVDARRVRRIKDMKAGPEENRVELDVSAGVGDHSVLHNLPDAVADKLDVRLSVGPKVVVAEHDALTADPEARGQPRADRGIRHLLLEMPARDALECPQ